MSSKTLGSRHRLLPLSTVLVLHFALHPGLHEPDPCAAQLLRLKRLLQRRQTWLASNFANDFESWLFFNSAKGRTALSLSLSLSLSLPGPTLSRACAHLHVLAGLKLPVGDLPPRSALKGLKVKLTCRVRKQGIVLGYTQSNNVRRLRPTSLLGLLAEQPKVLSSYLHPGHVCPRGVGLLSSLAPYRA